MKLREDVKNFLYLAGLFAGSWIIVIGLGAGLIFGIPALWRMLGG